MTKDIILSQEDAYRHAEEYLKFLGFGKILDIKRINSNEVISYYIVSLDESNGILSRKLTVMALRDFKDLIKSNLSLKNEDILNVSLKIGEIDKFIVKRKSIKKTKDKTIRRLARVFSSV